MKRRIIIGFLSVAAIATAGVYFGHFADDRQAVVASTPSSGNHADEPSPTDELIASIMARATIPTDDHDGLLLPRHVVASDDINDYTNEARCRDPLFVDSSCGWPYATTPVAELLDAAEGGDALAIFSLGRRAMHRGNHHQSISWLRDALTLGSLESIHGIATNLSILADALDAAHPEVRELLVIEAHGYLLAGMMLHPSPALMTSSMSLRHKYPDIPVTRAACDAAFSIIIELNREREARGMRPFPMRFFGTEDLLHHQQDAYGNCL